MTDPPKDEFYTLYSDIKSELNLCGDYFRNKTVYCSCDSPFDSNFSKFFQDNFSKLGLKKLVVTEYKDQTPDLFSNHAPHKPNGMIYFQDEFIGQYVQYFELDSDGSYDSPQCLDFLQQSDMVVTNPPFSRLQDFIKLLISNNKDFLIIGNLNTICCAEMFEYVKSGMLWFGSNIPKKFTTKTQQYVTFGNTRWLTNITYTIDKKQLTPTHDYSANKYPKYENFDAINVDELAQIPKDYDGVIGVPITFLDYYQPQTWEIVGLGKAPFGLRCGIKPYTQEHKYFRKNIQGRQAHDGDLYIMKDGVVHVPYMRILIKRKH